METPQNREGQSESPGAAQRSPIELEVFALVAAALNRLDRDAQIRMLRTLATYFDLPSPGHSPSRGSSLALGERSAETRSTSPTFSEDRAPTPKEFLASKRPITDVERIACLAYYLTHYRETPHFKTLDLSKLNTEAAQLKFSNAAYATDNAAKAGLLVPAAKGAKQISAMGEAYVQALPDRAAAKAVLAHGRPRRKQGRSKRGERLAGAQSPESPSTNEETQ